MTKLITIISICLLSSALVAEQNNIHPKDVSAFIEERDLCNHFRGEPRYNKERTEFLIKNITKLCTGTDARLLKLKTKYKNNKVIIKALSYYEENIEP